jgi:hypothetical protein
MRITRESGSDPPNLVGSRGREASDQIDELLHLEIDLHQVILVRVELLRSRTLAGPAESAYKKQLDEIELQLMRQGELLGTIRTEYDSARRMVLASMT